MIKGIKLKLGDTEYIVPPLALGALEDLQDQLGTFTGGADPESVRTVIDSATAALKRNYPDITRDQVRNMIGLENMAEVLQAVMDVSGLRRKEIEEGEAPPGNP